MAKKKRGKGKGAMFGGGKMGTKMVADGEMPMHGKKGRGKKKRSGKKR